MQQVEDLFRQADAAAERGDEAEADRLWIAAATLENELLKGATK